MYTYKLIVNCCYHCYYETIAIIVIINVIINVIIIIIIIIITTVIIYEAWRLRPISLRGLNYPCPAWFSGHGSLAVSPAANIYIYIYIHISLSLSIYIYIYIYTYIERDQSEYLYVACLYVCALYAAVRCSISL